MRLDELAAKLGAVLHGDGEIEITGVAGIREARAGQVTFLANPKYESFVATTNASALIAARRPPGRSLPVLEVEEPYLAFVNALGIFSRDRLGAVPGIHDSAILGKDVVLGEGVSIGPLVVIGDGAAIGDRTVLMSGCFVGGATRIGADAHLYPNVVVREDSILGDRVVVHSGAVIGSDGFGFARDGESVRKIPQIGNVEVGDDVEIGANTTIDRATTGTTRIGRGSKIDNLVMVAHNVQIGANTLVCAQVGISGSATVGDGVTLAGQVGLVGHISVGDRVQVGAQGGVTKSIPSGESVSGYPALPHRQARRIYAAMRSLPDIVRTVRELCRRVAALEGGERRRDRSDGRRRERE
ncbi:MAG: UDP-3-O-(3-hydroxymyristoyl)glucosamine N-acyltransferase [Candidatus Eisenbacteria bacterium]|nr:UDP-3-O-(3-hydroxymyristoyl)glucosamine N-acyltransferase [Candidatus Latescibacterota bacterium]MBD3302093.1 UDP-3-O-(3-hydroxymyristoyl)glucosamine N-acyltransferase [Candidatus Eisenbacteria bacterium]